MKYYKQGDKVKAFELDGSQDHLITDDMRLITKERAKKVVERNRLSRITWDTIRSQRDSLLTNSDWTQLPDVPLSSNEKELWSAYRNELRNITSKYKTPKEVIWPTKP